MSKKSSDRVSPTAAAIMLSAILAAAGQMPAPAPSAAARPRSARAPSNQRRRALLHRNRSRSGRSSIASPVEAEIGGARTTRSARHVGYSSATE
jgi:hypothetical protein